jgi:GNAT superfamily N-acetyltransferase
MSVRVELVEDDEGLEAWAAIKSRVEPDDPVTPEQVARGLAPSRLLILAHLDGRPVGCGGADLSTLGGLAVVKPRVLPEARGRGVGRTLFDRLTEHARALGVEGIVSYVDDGDERSIDFARRSGLQEIDYQLEQTRAIHVEETPPEVPEGIEIVTVTDELLRAAYDAVGEQGYEDMPLARSAWMPLDHWLRTEATRRGGSFVALHDGEIVGYAGMWEHANGDATAEHGLTAVRREYRRRGIATALKRTQLGWAARTGVRELVTRTQKGNEPMQELNRKLGYVDRSRLLTFQGPLP